MNEIVVQHGSNKFCTKLVPGYADGELHGFHGDEYIGHLAGYLSCSGSRIVTECCIKYASFPHTLPNEGNPPPTSLFGVHDETVRRVVDRCIWRRSSRYKKSLTKLTIVENVIGNLEPEIASFHQLKHLVLDECEYTGNLNLIGRLSNLEILEIGTLSVDLPNEIFQLRFLRVLILKYNKEIGFTPSYEQASWLQKLEHLQLWGPNVSLTTEILSIVSLKKLEVLFSQTIRVPTEIDRLINLEVLTFYECPFLTELPNSIGNLKKLKQLTLYRYYSVDLPPIVLGFRNLKHLMSLSISGEVPHISFRNLKNLVSLSISGKVEYISPAISSLVNLESLDIECIILNPIPEMAIKGLPKLTDLSICISDTFPGSIPDICPRTLRSLTVKSRSVSSFRNQILNPPSLKEYCPSLESFVSKIHRDQISNLDLVQLAESLPTTLQHLDLLVYHGPGSTKTNRMNCGISPYFFSDDDAETTKISCLFETYHQLRNVHDVSRLCYPVFFCSHWMPYHQLMQYNAMPLSMQRLMYLLMLHKCGRRTYRSPKPLPLSVWPDVLSKVHDRVYGSVLYYRKFEKDCKIIEASVIYSLLRSDAFASAGGAFV